MRRIARASRWNNRLRRALSVLYLTACSASATAFEQQPLDGVVSFDIPEQRADLALIEFARQADRTLVFSFDVAMGKTANRLVGEFTVLEGLHRLLAGSHLAISLGGEGQLTIVEGAPVAPGKAADDGEAVGAVADDNVGDLGTDPYTEEDAERLLDEIMVMARKREEALQDVPTSASILTTTILNGVGLRKDLRDVTDLVVGVTINDTQLAPITEPSIRGAGGGRNRMSASATGLYRNGAYIASAGPGGKNFARMDYFDMERAEILRGPQGALYGRNALGGAINLISRQPRDYFGVDITVRGGELDLFGIEAIANLPLTDSFAVRASHVDERRYGANYRDIDGHPVDTTDYRHSRVSVRYQPAGYINVGYSFDTQEQRFAPTIRLSDEAVAFTGNEFDTLINDPHFDDWEVQNHNLALSVAAGNGSIEYTGNYRERLVKATQDSDYYLEATGQPNFLDRRRFEQSSDASIAFHEIRYLSEESSRVSWLVGADVFGFDNHDVTDLTKGCPEPAVPDLIDENYFCASSLWIRDNDFGMRSWAAFGSIAYALESVPMTLTAEARISNDELEGNLVQFRPNRAPFPELMRDFVVNQDWQNIPWGVTAAYEFERLDALGYLKVSSSYRQGGMNDGPGSEQAKFEARLQYDEETNVTYEIGWKQMLLGNRMTLNFAGYLGLYDDFIAGTTDGCPDECTLLDENGDPLGFNPDGSRIGEDQNGDPIPPNTEIATTAFMDNVGEVEIWGFEAELAYRYLTADRHRMLDFRVGYSRQFGEVTRLNEDVAEALRVRALGARVQYMRPNQVKSQVVFRNELPSLGSVPGFGGARILMSANYVFESGGVWDLDIDAPNPMDPVRRLNARIGLETDRWSLMIDGRNLTDERYRTWTNSANDVYRRSDPRHVFAEFRYNLR